MLVNYRTRSSNIKVNCDFFCYNGFCYYNKSYLQLVSDHQRVNLHLIGPGLSFMLTLYAEKYNYSVIAYALKHKYKWTH